MSIARRPTVPGDASGSDPAKNQGQPLVDLLSDRSGHHRYDQARNRTDADKVTAAIAAQQFVESVVAVSLRVHTSQSAAADW